MTIMPAASRQYDCHSSTDWFTLSAQHDAFRLRWDQPAGRGWETCYRLPPGLWLRTLDLEQASGCLPAWIPGGHLTLAGMLDGDTALETPEGRPSIWETVSCCVAIVVRVLPSWTAAPSQGAT